MKTLKFILATTSLSLGAVVGAGFVSGSELVCFFGTENYLPYLIITGVIFALSIFAVFSAALKFNSSIELNEALFGRDKPVSVATLSSAFIFFTSMLAGLDALWNLLGYLSGIPIFSILALLAVSFFAKYGVEGLEKLNLFLMPVVLLIINCSVFFGGNADFSSNGRIEFGGVGRSLLYVCMNVFVSLPVLNASAVGKSKKALFISAVAVATIICVEAAVILAAVKFAGTNAAMSEMPLLMALGGEKFPFFLFVALLFGTVTSLASSYYPLYEFAKKKNGKTGVLILGILSFCASRLGLKAIVYYAYPVVGAFGAVYLARLLVFNLKRVLKFVRKAKKY